MKINNNSQRAVDRFPRVYNYIYAVFDKYNICGAPKIDEFPLEGKRKLVNIFLEECSKYEVECLTEDLIFNREGLLKILKSELKEGKLITLEISDELNYLQRWLIDLVLKKHSDIFDEIYRYVYNEFDDYRQNYDVDEKIDRLKEENLCNKDN